MRALTAGAGWPQPWGWQLLCVGEPVEIGISWVHEQKRALELIYEDANWTVSGNHGRLKCENSSCVTILCVLKLLNACTGVGRAQYVAIEDGDDHIAVDFLSVLPEDRLPACLTSLEPQAWKIMCLMPFSAMLDTCTGEPQQISAALFVFTSGAAHRNVKNKLALRLEVVEDPTNNYELELSLRKHQWSLFELSTLRQAVIKKPVCRKGPLACHVFLEPDRLVLKTETKITRSYAEALRELVAAEWLPRQRTKANWIKTARQCLPDSANYYQAMQGPEMSWGALQCEVKRTGSKSMVIFTDRPLRLLVSCINVLDGSTTISLIEWDAVNDAFAVHLEATSDFSNTLCADLQRQRSFSRQQMDGACYLLCTAPFVRRNPSEPICIQYSSTTHELVCALVQSTSENPKVAKAGPMPADEHSWERMVNELTDVYVQRPDNWREDPLAVLKENPFPDRSMVKHVRLLAHWMHVEDKTACFAVTAEGFVGLNWTKLIGLRPASSTDSRLVAFEYVTGGQSDMDARRWMQGEQMDAAFLQRNLVDPDAYSSRLLTVDTPTPVSLLAAITASQNRRWALDNVQQNGSARFWLTFRGLTPEDFNEWFQYIYCAQQPIVTKRHISKAIDYLSAMGCVAADPPDIIRCPRNQVLPSQWCLPNPACPKLLKVNPAKFMDMLADCQAPRIGRSSTHIMTVKSLPPWQRLLFCHLTSSVCNRVFHGDKQIWRVTGGDGRMKLNLLVAEANGWISLFRHQEWRDHLAPLDQKWYQLLVTAIDMACSSIGPDPVVKAIVTHSDLPDSQPSFLKVATAPDGRLVLASPHPIRLLAAFIVLQDDLNIENVSWRADPPAWLEFHLNASCNAPDLRAAVASKLEQIRSMTSPPLIAAVHTALDMFYAALLERESALNNLDTDYPIACSLPTVPLSASAIRRCLS